MASPQQARQQLSIVSTTRVETVQKDRLGASGYGAGAVERVVRRMGLAGPGWRCSQLMPHELSLQRRRELSLQRDGGADFKV